MAEPVGSLSGTDEAGNVVSAELNGSVLTLQLDGTENVGERTEVGELEVSVKVASDEPVDDV